MSGKTPDLDAATIEARTALAADVRELIDGYCPDIPMCPRCQAREGEVLVLADTYAVAAAQTSVTMAEQLDAMVTVLQETSRESSQRGEQVRLAREDRDQLRKRVLDLAADLEAEGREEITMAQKAQKRQGWRDEVGMQRGRVFKLCASRIRKIAEPS